MTTSVTRARCGNGFPHRAFFVRTQKEKRMLKDNSETGGRAVESEQVTEDSPDQRRKRLAQRIGRLLARTWLERRREKETLAVSSNDSSAESRAN